MLDRDDWIYFLGGFWTVLGIVVAQWTAGSLSDLTIATIVFVLVIGLFTFVGRLLTRLLLSRMGYSPNPDDPR